MNKDSSYIDNIIAAIDAGQNINVDITSVPIDQRAEIQSLLKLANITYKIKQRQSSLQFKHMKEGDQWAHLNIEDKISEGGFGQVFRAFDTTLQTHVAVKFINPDKQLMIDHESLLIEARMLAKVRNPHVLAIHGATIDKGIVGYWFDFLDGKTLYHCLKRNSLTAEQKMKIIVELVQAVKATHENGVIHGDIKSLNVMLQPKRGAILLDFGAGRFSQKSVNENFTTQVSPMAMAPELHELKFNSFASDIYALGLIIHEVLTGKHLFLNSDNSSLQTDSLKAHEKIRQQPINRQWKSLLSKMLAPLPKHRPDIATSEKCINKILKTPLKRAKRLALATALLLLTAVTTISLFSYREINEANQQTNLINQLLSNTFLTLTPYQDGKSVMLVDVLHKAWQNINESDAMLSQHKQNLKTKLLGTFLVLNEFESVMKFSDELLSEDGLELLNLIKVKRYQASVFLHQKEYEKTKETYHEILALPVSSQAIADEQILSLSMLYYVYLQRQEFEKIPELNQILERLKPQSSNNLSQLGNISYVKGLYYKRIDKPQMAKNAFNKSVEYYTQAYHANYYATLTSESMAADVYSMSKDKQLQQRSIIELEQVIPRMKKYMGEDHTTTLSTIINLGITYNHSGHPEKAIQLYQSIEPIIHEKFGPNSKFTLEALERNYLGALLKAKNFELMKLKAKSIIERYRIYHPEDITSLMTARFNFITGLTEAQLINEANSEAKNTLIECEQNLSEDHRFCIEAKLYLWRFSKGKNVPEQYMLLEQLLVKSNELFGIDDPLSLKIQNELNANKNYSNENITPVTTH